MKSRSITSQPAMNVVQSRLADQVEATRRARHGHGRASSRRWAAPARSGRCSPDDLESRLGGRLPVLLRGRHHRVAEGVAQSTPARRASAAGPGAPAAASARRRRAATRPPGASSRAHSRISSGRGPRYCEDSSSHDDVAAGIGQPASQRVRAAKAHRIGQARRPRCAGGPCVTPTALVVIPTTLVPGSAGSQPAGLRTGAAPEVDDPCRRARVGGRGHRPGQILRRRGEIGVAGGRTARDGDHRRG